MAEWAGVSTPVVSYVLNGKAKENRIPDETAQKVLRAARLLDYHPSAWAKILRRRRSNLFLLVSREVTDGHAGRLMRALAAAARSRGCHVMTLDLDRDKDIPEDDFSTIAASMVDGIVIHGLHDSRLEYLSDDARLCGKPVCVMGRELSGIDIPWVEVDNRLGGEMAMRHLFEQGCTRVGVLIDWPIHDYTRARIEGVQQALQAFPGCEVDFRYRPQGTKSFDVGARETMEWLREDRLPDGIFAVGDTRAMGVLSVLNLHGIRCPEQVKVVGFDGEASSRYASPPLSTVSQPVEAMAEAALDILETALTSGQMPEVRQRRLPPELIVRASSSLAKFQALLSERVGTSPCPDAVHIHQGE